VTWLFTPAFPNLFKISFFFFSLRPIWCDSLKDLAAESNVPSHFFFRYFFFPLFCFPFTDNPEPCFAAFPSLLPFPVFIGPIVYPTTPSKVFALAFSIVPSSFPASTVPFFVFSRFQNFFSFPILRCCFPSLIFPIFSPDFPLPFFRPGDYWLSLLQHFPACFIHVFAWGWFFFFVGIGLLLMNRSGFL